MDHFENDRSSARDIVSNWNWSYFVTSYGPNLDNINHRILSEISVRLAAIWQKKYSKWKITPHFSSLMKLVRIVLKFSRFSVLSSEDSVLAPLSADF